MKGSIESYFTVLKKNDQQKETKKSNENIPKIQEEKPKKNVEENNSTKSNSSSSRSDTSEEEKSIPKKPLTTNSYQKPKTSKFSSTYLSNWTSKYKVMRASHFNIEIEERKLRKEKKKLESENPILEKVENAIINLAKLTMEERNIYKNYDMKLDDNKLPTFWPSRIWDNDYTALSKQESNNLEKKIDNIIKEYENIQNNSSENKNNENSNKEENVEENKSEHIVIKRENFIDNPQTSSKLEEISKNSSDSENSPKSPVSRPKETSPKRIIKKIKPILYVSTKIFDTDDEYEETDWFDE